MSSKQLTGATSSVESPLQKANIDAHKGKLFVIEPLEVEKDIETTNGTSDATRSNIWVVRSKDGKKVDEYLDVLVFQKVLQGQLRRAMGKSVVYGRLTQLDPKPGKSPAWALADPTDADTAAASAFWSSHSLAPAKEESAEGFSDDDDEDAF